MRLAVMHNLWFYNELMAKIREALDNGHLCRLPGEIQWQSRKTGLIWNGFACCGR